MRREGAAAILTLDDPKRRNILSGELCRALSRAIAEANANAEVKAIVIMGTPPAFCAGADLDDLKAAAAGEADAVRAVYQSFIDVADSPLPTIAAVNGAAIGAGFNLALACDVRLASTDALFDTRFLKIGLHPGGGHGWMLERAVGWAEASRLLLFGTPVGAEEALRIGLAQEVTSPETLLEAALTMAARAATVPRELLARTKASLRHAVTADHAAAFARETGEQMWSLGQPAFGEMVKRLQTSIKAR